MIPARPHSVRGATPTAGAVLRPTGSSRMACGMMPSSPSCSATRKRWASLQTTMGAATFGRPAVLSAVSWIIVRSPTSGRNCFG